MVLLAFGSSSASASPGCPADEIQPTLETGYETAMAVVCDINMYRVRSGLTPLRWDWRLWSAAQGQASDMAARHYAAHVTPEGKGLADRVGPTGYIPDGASWLLAENLGWGTTYLSTPLAIVIGWINSDEHRENMLDPEFRDIGVGIDQGAITAGGDSGVVYVVDFGMRETPVDTLRISARPKVRARPAGTLRIRGRAGRTRRR